MAEPTILHVNVTDFMAAVEEARDPSLRGWPFVVAWKGRSRALVLSVSMVAFQEGVRRGMGVEAAQRAVRGLKVLPPAYEVYRRVDARLAEIGGRFSPLVEPRGGGHLYLDLRGTRRLFGPPEDCAERVRKEIREGTGLDPALALAAAKVVSKVGTRVARPYGFIFVAPGQEGEFLSPLDVSLLPGVGDRLLHRLRLLEVRTIGELAALSDQEAAVLGPRGVLLRNRARGVDPSPLEKGSSGLTPWPDTLGKEGGEGKGEGSSSLYRGSGVLRLSRNLPLSGTLCFAQDGNDPPSVLRSLRSLLRTLGFSLREQRARAGLLRLQVAYTDGVQAQGTWRFPYPVSLDRDLIQAGERLLPVVVRRRVRLRSIRCVLDSVAPEVNQLELFTSYPHSSLPRLEGPFPGAGSPRLRLYGVRAPADGRGRLAGFVSEGSNLCGIRSQAVGPGEDAKAQALQRSLDRIRRRFGSEGIRPCAELGEVPSAGYP